VRTCLPKDNNQKELESMSDEYVRLFAELKEEEVIDMTRRRIEAGEDPLNILDDTREGMAVVGRRFADQEYFLPELILSGELLKECVEMVKPLLKSDDAGEKLGKRAKVVIGTVAGDIHDIGLNIVGFVLDVNGFEVVNLGVNVPPERFVEVVAEERPAIVGLSGFITVAFDAMRDTVEALENAGLREEIKIMIGGGQVDDDICRYAKADAYGRDAMAAVSLSSAWVGV
jgi:5-methyltetrahydrofolate--homocysteine methyltransferase